MRSLLSLRLGLECVDQSWCRGCRELPEPGSRQIAGMDPEPTPTATTLSCPLPRGVSGGIGYLSHHTGTLFLACAVNIGRA